jgi:hypothetical protein
MRRRVRVAGLVLLAVIVIGVVAVVGMVGIRPFVGPRERALTDRQFEATPERLERGRYVANSVSLCLGCHSEINWNVPGFALMPGTEGSGRNWAEEGAPWISAPNLTADPETGAGRWTDDMLARAIREGVGHDGRALFPMMPYEQFRYMSDEDLASVIVYIRSLPPVRKTLPPSEIPFPVNRLINSVPEPLTAPVPEPDRTDAVAYGDYLVRVGVCRDCHTPLDDQGQRIPGLEFAGGMTLTGPYGRVTAANITQDPSGIPYYTAELFLEMMRTGMVKARKIHDQMPWALYAKQTDDDLRAIFAYLQTIEPVRHRVDNSLPPTDCPRCGLPHGAGDRNQPAE